MRKLDININQAKLLKYVVELKDDKVEVYASVGLYSGKKKVSEFSIGNQSYYSVRFDLPIEMIDPIMALAKQLEAIVVRECRKEMGRIEYKKEAGDGN